MNKEFIPYEQALALKELRFNEPCFGCYFHNNKDVVEYNPDGIPLNHNNRNSRISAPLYQQVFKFFREEYQMVFCYEPCLKKDLTYIFFIYIEKTGEKVFVIELKYNKEAELECLKKLIEIANEKSI